MALTSPPALALAVLAAGLSAGCSQGAGASSTTTIDPDDPVIHVTAHQWSFSPGTITLTEGVPVTLELLSQDVHHGFNLPDFEIRADILPNEPTRLRLVPDRKGTFAFFCDYYCGGGHEDMTGVVIVH